MRKVSAERTKRKNDRYAVGVGKTWGGEGEVEVCLHVLEGVRELRRRRRQTVA